MRLIISFIVLAGLFSASVYAKPAWNEYANKSDDWYRSPQGSEIISKVLSWQDAEGAWPKNVDTAAQRYQGDPEKLKGSFDNAATTPEIRFLARAYRATHDRRCLDAIDKGLDLIIKAQYPSGGWPQSYPPDKKYHRFITFNDDAIVRLLALLKDAASSDNFEFIDAQRKAEAKESFEKGIACILKCQIIVNGKLTVWCAQHDEKDYSPRPGRAFEMISLSGSESAGILHLLMSLDNPNAEAIRAVKAGAEWFDSAKITGIRQISLNGDKQIVADKNARPLWARFYDIDTNRPIFCGRDGVKKYDISEIDPERRNGYAWYGDWGAKILMDYARWKDKWLKPETKTDMPRCPMPSGPRGRHAMPLTIFEKTPC